MDAGRARGRFLARHRGVAFAPASRYAPEAASGRVPAAKEPNDDEKNGRRMMSELQVIQLLLASGAIGLQVPKVRRIARRPRLRLFTPSDCSPNRVRIGARHALVYSVRLGNAGSSAAHGCRALLERVEYWNGSEWLLHPGFRFAFQLPWSAVGGRSSIDVPAFEVSEDLPLIIAFRDSRKIRLATPLQIVSGTLLEYPPGMYRLTVKVRGTGQPEPTALGQFIVEYEGDWETVVLRTAK